MTDLFFKDDKHKKDYDLIIRNLHNCKYPIEHGAKSFAYIASATGKTTTVLDSINHEGLDFDILLKKIKVFSTSEQAMLRFAVQCFNPNYDNINLHDVFYSLDPANEKVVYAAIKIAHRLRF